VERIVRRLYSLSARRSARAEIEMDALGPEYADEILAAVQDEYGLLGGISRLFGLAVLMSLIFLTAGFVAERTTSEYVAVVGLLAALALPVTLFYPVSRGYCRATRAIGRLGDKRAAGPIVEFLRYPFAGLAEESRKALMRLLPRLDPEDAPLLSSLHRRILCRSLTPSDPGFTLAVLKAFGRIGGRHELWFVKSVAMPRFYDDKVLAHAAETCAMEIRSRLTRGNDRMTLLRASTADAEDPSELLRAAGAGDADPPSELLRPGEVDAEAIAIQEGRALEAGMEDERQRIGAAADEAEREDAVFRILQARASRNEERIEPR
jgi:hypothetical protein